VGTDMAGVVTAVGSNVSSNKLKVGDGVIGCFFEFGGLPSHVVVPADRVVKLPSNLTFADGSTLPAVFTTAYYSLVDVARLKNTDTILIHTASGGVGNSNRQTSRGQDYRNCRESTEEDVPSRSDGNRERISLARFDVQGRYSRIDGGKGS